MGGLKPFEYQRGMLHAEEVPLSRLAEEVGTPTYVYSASAIRNQLDLTKLAFSKAQHLVCYSVKANSNLSVLRLVAGSGAGFDVVSGGELARCLQINADPKKIVFAGVGKTADEMRDALAAQIRMFNVESAEELEALDAVAQSMNVKAPFAIRVNPHVDAKTHKYIATGLKSSKFGIPFEEAKALYRKSRSMRGLQAVGLDCHIGSQLTSIGPVKEAVEKVAALYNSLRADGHPLELLDVGGGLGITYAKEKPPSLELYARTVIAASRSTEARLVLEPGRLIVGNAGLLLTRVVFRKRKAEAGKAFVIGDAGMNDLMRPALYDAHHELLPVSSRRGERSTVDLVGPVCESADVIASNRRMVLPKPGELMAIMSAGAYSMSMASTYNSRPRPAEVLVEGHRFRVIRRREAVEDLWRDEL